MPDLDALRARLEAASLFDPNIYLALNEDVKILDLEPWQHFLQHGLSEGRRFTNTEVLARFLIRFGDQIKQEIGAYRENANLLLVEPGFAVSKRLSKLGITVGVFYHTKGNFYMKALAELVRLGFKSAGINVMLRNQTSEQSEPFDVRVFVAPHEFFTLEEGAKWAHLAGDRTSILYNVEQLQTPWFCRAFSLLLDAPLVLDLNFQSAVALRNAGLNAVYFAPGYMPSDVFTAPVVDVSKIELVMGYPFATQRYDWLATNDIESRPIDLLFMGTKAKRRDKLLEGLVDLVDNFRFICVYRSNHTPLTERNYAHASTQIACALGQRAKIVLNIHRDWIGYFEWSRIVMQGIWQGACVVSDPGLPDPIFEAGAHYLEEDSRHLGELIRWLLGTADGLETLNRTRVAGYERARTLGCMRVAFTPVLVELEKILTKRFDGVRQ